MAIKVTLLIWQIGADRKTTDRWVSNKKEKDYRSGSGITLTKHMNPFNKCDHQGAKLSGTCGHSNHHVNSSDNIVVILKKSRSSFLWTLQPPNPALLSSFLCQPLFRGEQEDKWKESLLHWILLTQQFHFLQPVKNIPDLPVVTSCFQN